MRLIDADVLEQDGWCMNRIVQIDEKTMEYQTRKPTDFPTIEPKKGRWIKHEDRAGWYCSECATVDCYAYFYNSDTGVYIYELQDKFCPSCGADMREGVAE